MAILGYNTIGTAGTENWNGPYFGCKFTPIEDGTITKIWVYCSFPFGVGSYNFKVAIYSESGGEWDIKEVEATSIAGYNETAQWRSVDISYSFSNGVPIYLAAFGENALAVPYDVGTTSQTLAKWSAVYPTFENPDSGIEIDPWDREMSIYAEYTPVDLVSSNRVGLFAKEIIPIGWFDETADINEGWFDEDFLYESLVSEYTMVCSQGSFSLDGQDIDLIEARQIILDQGSYLLDGQLTSLLYNKILQLSNVSFSLDGQSVNLTYNPLVGYTLACDSGVVNLNGQVVNLHKDSLLVLDSVSFNLSGQNINLLQNRVLVSDQGLFTLNGQSTSLVRNLLLVAQGLFTLSGQNLSLLYSTGINFSFTLTISSTTSAGIYYVGTDILVRTLWNNIIYASGTHSSSWDRKNDRGVTMPDGPYEVRVISNNITYVWNGTIGNTSDDLYGEDVIKGLRGIQCMSTYNNIAYIEFGFQEGNQPSSKIDLDISLHHKTDILQPISGDVDLETIYNDTDGTLVYRCGPDTFNATTSFCFATTVATDAEYAFSSGSAAACVFGRTYNNAIDIETLSVTTHPTGLAVMKTGIYLYISHGGVNELRVFNKTTGAFVRTITVTNPGNIRIDTSDNLWMISNGTTIAKYTINGDGTISAATLTLSGLVQPKNLDIQKNAALVAVIDGGASQQVKAFNASTGISSWTLGVSGGGYDTNSAVTSTKFMFDHPEFQDGTFARAFIAFDDNDNFYVQDGYNFRVQKFNSSRVLQDTMMNMRMLYTVSANKNDPTMIFGDALEFYRDHSISYGRKNSSWYLKNNWYGNITSDYVPIDPLNSRDIFKDCVTLSNGRVYALIRKLDIFEVPTFQFVELVNGGVLRFITSVVLDEWVNYLLDKNGDLYYLDGDIFTALSTVTVQKRTRTGFDGSNNPIYSAASTYATFPALDITEPIYRATANLAKIGDEIWVFAKDKENQGFHLGAIASGGTSYRTITSPSTSPAYSGDFPTDGRFDIGNLVENAGGQLLGLDNSIFWNYLGEFWKNDQVNKWNHFHKNGLMLGQFGITGIDAIATDGRWAPREMAGNVNSTAIVKYGSDYYIYHCDEGTHCSIHEWRISGLDTIVEQSKIISTNLVTHQIIVLDQGDFNVTGQNINLVYSPLQILQLQQGGFSLTGVDLTLLKQNVLGLQYGNYTLLGQELMLLKNILVILGQGNFSIVGNNISLNKNKILVIDYGDFDLTVQDIDLSRQRYITLSLGSFVFTGNTIVLDYSGVVSKPREIRRLFIIQ